MAAEIGRIYLIGTSRCGRGRLALVIIQLLQPRINHGNGAFLRSYSRGGAGLGAAKVHKARRGDDLMALG